MESLIEEYDTERVPNDWELKQLGEIADIVGGGTPSTFIPEYWNGDINWFTPTEIGLSKYSFESSRKITRKGLENSSAKVLPEGAILLTSRAAIGDVSILMKEGCTNQGFQSLIAKKGVNNEYLYYLASTLKRIFLQNASGSTFLEISPKKVKSVIVSVPQSQEEQIAIATALSDTDALIENLEKLIAKKRNIKQGVMQELLTGRKRLEGFNGEWDKIKIGEVADIHKGNGLSKTKLKSEGKYGCILYGELFTTYKRIIKNAISRTDYEEGVYSRAGDILMPGSTTTTGIDLAIASAVLKDNILLGGILMLFALKPLQLIQYFLLTTSLKY